MKPGGATLHRAALLAVALVAVPAYYAPGAITKPAPAPLYVVAAADAAAGSKAAATAVCDGTADDVQIQQAIDSTRPVYLSEGTFVLAAPLKMGEKRVVLSGASVQATTVRQADGANLPVLIVGTARNERVTVRDLRLDGNRNANRGTVGIDATNLPYIRVQNVDVVLCPDDGLRNVAYARSVMSARNGGWGFNNSGTGLTGTMLKSEHNGRGGFYLSTDSTLTCIKSDEEPVSIYCPSDSYYPITVHGAEITMSNEGGSNVGLWLDGGNPGANISTVTIDMVGDNLTGVRIGSSAAGHNTVGAALGNVSVRGRTENSGQTGVELDIANRCVLQNVVITTVDVGFLLNDGALNQVVGGAVYDVETPVLSRGGETGESCAFTGVDGL